MQALSNYLEKLTSLTHDMYYSLVGDEPYVPNSWNVKECGTFSFEKWLVDQKVLTAYKLLHFKSLIRSTQSAASYSGFTELLEVLNKNLADFHIYGYSLPDLPIALFNGDNPMDVDEYPPFGVPLFLGKMSDGQWLGLVLEQGYSRNEVAFLETHFKNATSPKINPFLSALANSITQIDFDLKTPSWKMKKTWQAVVTSSRSETI